MPPTAIQLQRSKEAKKRFLEMRLQQALRHQQSMNRQTEPSRRNNGPADGTKPQGEKKVQQPSNKQELDQQNPAEQNHEVHDGGSSRIVMRPSTCNRSEGQVINRSEQKSDLQSHHHGSSRIVTRRPSTRNHPEGQVINPSEQKFDPKGQVINWSEQKSDQQNNHHESSRIITRRPSTRNYPEGQVINRTEQKSDPEGQVINRSEQKSEQPNNHHGSSRIVTRRPSTRNYPEGQVINRSVRTVQSDPEGQVINRSEQKSEQPNNHHGSSRIVTRRPSTRNHPEGQVINRSEQKSDQQNNHNKSSRIVTRRPSTRNHPEGQVVNRSEQKSDPEGQVINRSEQKSDQQNNHHGSSHIVTRRPSTRNHPEGQGINHSEQKSDQQNHDVKCRPSTGIHLEGQAIKDQTDKSAKITSKKQERAKKWREKKALAKITAAAASGLADSAHGDLTDTADFSVDVNTAPCTASIAEASPYEDDEKSQEIDAIASTSTVSPLVVTAGPSNSHACQNKSMKTSAAGEHSRKAKVSFQLCIDDSSADPNTSAFISPELRAPDFAAINVVGTTKNDVDSMLQTDTNESNTAVENREAWSIIHTLPLEEMDKFIANHDAGFRLKTENTPSKGRMRYYNCTRIKSRAKPQCARQLLAFIPNTSGTVTISARGKHTCQDAPVENMARSKVTIEHKELIDHLLGSGLPGKDVKTHLKLTDGNIAKGALNYAVNTSKKKLFGSGKLSLGELEQWVASKSAIPDDAQEAFVIGGDIDHENKKFRIVISSKRLLSLIPHFKTLAADCTFKTTLQGYPLLVVCVIDEMRKAHPVAFACISNQEQTDYQFVFQTLQVAVTKQGGKIKIASFLSDGELALKNAARYVFGQAVLLLNCYFHVKQNLIKHFKKSAEMPPEVQEQVKREVALLQIAPTKQHFAAALELFVEKYKIYEAFSQFFSKYAQNEKFALWYEAAQPGVPATNNALEAINKSIKYNYLKRHREPLGTFKVQMLHIVHAYSTPDRQVAMERAVNLADERKAFDMLKGPKKLRTINTSHVYIPGKGKIDVSSMDVARFENPVYSSLEAYEEDHGLIHRVQVNGGRFNTWTCTCTHFFKSNGCAHILVVAVRRNCYTLSPEANTALLSTKKSGGRPKYVSKALCVE